MKVSVIIPVYKSEDFLSQCLGSVVNQSYDNLEIIVINDGTPDNSAQIYNEFAQSDPRIKIIKQKNMGLAAARNAGLNAATGEWVHFLDSDDYIDADYYEKMLAAASATDADIAVGGVVSQNNAKFSISYTTRLVLTGLRERFKITRALDVCTVWRYVFRRKFLTQNNMRFAVGRIFEDMLFTPDAIRLANRIVTVPGVNYHYVFNENSILNKKYSPNHDTQYKFARKNLSAFIEKYGLQSLHNKKAEVTVYKFLCFKIFKKASVAGEPCNIYYLFGIRILKAYKANDIIITRKK